MHAQWGNHCIPGREFGGLFKEEFAELEASCASCSRARRKFNFKGVSMCTSTA